MYQCGVWRERLCISAKCGVRDCVSMHCVTTGDYQTPRHHDVIPTVDSADVTASGLPLLCPGQ